MPNFDVSIVSGVTPATWEDERIAHRGGAVHTYRKVAAPTAPALASVVLHCTVGGAFLTDAGLVGDLFVASRLGWAGSFPFAITQTPGTSAEITLTFAADGLGHQELVIRRPNGGAIVLSFEVE